MSLNAALQIGRSGLLAQQTALEVTGNNLANVASRGYHRQVAQLAPVGASEIQSGIFVGRGVQVAAIVRMVDEALEGRIRSAVGDEAGSDVRRNTLAQVEAIFNEMGDTDLSTRLSDFFNAWSELANRPQENSLRSLVVQQGQALAGHLQDVRASLVSLRGQVDAQIDQGTAAANNLLTQIEQLNRQITLTEGGTGSAGAGALRDQRDDLLSQLAQYLDISVREQPSGSVDVFVGSMPVILAGQSRGIEVRRQSVDGELRIAVVLSADGTELQASSGSLGALITARREDVNAAIDQLDRFANQLIYEVNKVHSQGQGLTGFAGVTAENRVADTTAALTSAAAGLNFTPVHGSFQIHLTQGSTGERVTRRIEVDLDGIGADATLADIQAAIDGLANVSAAITADGRLRISADSSDYTISFSDDSSGLLAALGINSFLAGKNAQDIAVSPVVRANLGAVAATRDHVAGGNLNALALAGLRTAGLPGLGGLTLNQVWNRQVEEVGVRLDQVQQKAQADAVVRESLAAQQQAVSGVNADEEAINLLSYQRAFQASARFITVVDEMMQTLLALV